LYVAAKIPTTLRQTSYGVATVPALVGAFGLLLPRAFVALRVNELVPKGLRLTNNRRFMRWSYALHLPGTLTGVIVCCVVYVGGSK